MLCTPVAYKLIGYASSYAEVRKHVSEAVLKWPCYRLVSSMIY